MTNPPYKNISAIPSGVRQRHCVRSSVAIKGGGGIHSHKWARYGIPASSNL